VPSRCTSVPVQMTKVDSSSNIIQLEDKPVPGKTPMINSKLKEALREKLESLKRRPAPEHVPGTQVNNTSGPLKVAKIGVPEDDKTSVVIRKNMHEPPGSPFQQTTIPAFPNYKFHPEKRLLGKPTYTIHIVNTSTKRRSNDQLKNILSIASPTKCIGAVIELDGKLSIEGYREKYEEPLRLIKKQFKTANPALSNFAYSNALLTTDVENAAMSICAEAAEGRRTLWAWSEDGVLWAKLDGSRWMNIHGKLLSWVGSAALKFKSPAEAKTYMVYTYRLSGLCEVEKTERAGSSGQERLLPKRVTPRRFVRFGHNDSRRRSGARSNGRPAANYNVGRVAKGKPPGEREWLVRDRTADTGSPQLPDSNPGGRCGHM
jgi:hypothetical protein